MSKRGTIGESHSDRAANKMDKFIARSKSQPSKNKTLLEQFQALYPNSWREEIEKTRTELKPWDPGFGKKPWDKQ